MKVWFFAVLATLGLLLSALCWLTAVSSPWILFMLGVDPDLRLLWELLFWGGVAAFVGFGGLALKFRFTGRKSLR